MFKNCLEFYSLSSFVIRVDNVIPGCGGSVPPSERVRLHHQRSMPFVYNECQVSASGCSVAQYRLRQRRCGADYAKRPVRCSREHFQTVCSVSDHFGRIIPRSPRLTTSDGRLVRAHCTPRHCIHSSDFLAVKVSPALLILFVNIVLLLKNCISVINSLFVFVPLFAPAECVHFIWIALHFREENIRYIVCLNTCFVLDNLQQFNADQRTKTSSIISISHNKYVQCANFFNLLAKINTISSNQLCL